MTNWTPTRGEGMCKDDEWWTDHDFYLLEDHWKQQALDEVHHRVCQCGLIRSRYEGSGPASIYFNQRDHYFGTLLNHVRQAVPDGWDMALCTVTNRIRDEWDKSMAEARARNNPPYTPKGA